MRKERRCWRFEREEEACTESSRRRVRAEQLGACGRSEGQPRGPLETRGPECKAKSAHMVTYFSNQVQLCGIGVTYFSNQGKVLC